MISDALAPWSIDAADYPRDAPPAARWRFLVGYAILAPSGHNTQPWIFRIDGDRLEVRADRTRCLPVVDPHDRALAISCGAAIACLEAALRGLGHAGEIALLPDADDPDLFARIGFGPPHASDAEDAKRLAAIGLRRTTRRAFADEQLPEGLAERMRALAEARGVALAIIADAAQKRTVAALVAEGDRAQFADPSFRRELAAWVHPRRTGDGLSGVAFGMPDVLSPVGGLVIRTFDMGDGIGAKDEAIAAGSPALLAFSTPADTPENWLAAGAAHLDVLLEVAAAGLTGAYLNQPVEVDALRPRLAEAIGEGGLPQLLMRIGRGPAIEPAARRPVEAVIEETP